MGTFICMAESLHCLPETTTTLLVGYTSIQNVFGVKKINKIKKISSKSRKLRFVLWNFKKSFLHASERYYPILSLSLGLPWWLRL